MSNLNYTTIHHSTRVLLGLSPYDYMVADLIYNLQNNPNSKDPGWCYATKGVMAKMLGMTERGVIKVIGRLEKMGLVEKSADSKKIKTSLEWYEKVVFINKNDTMNDVHEQRSSKTGTPFMVSMNTVHPKPGYDNNIDNKNDNSISEEGVSVEKGTNSPAEFSRTIGYLSAIPEEDINHWIEKFPVLSREIIIREAGKAKAWMEANGKRKKDYKAFMRNWLDNTAERLEKQKGGGYGPRVSVQE